jgi:hypothetical protein
MSQPAAAGSQHCRQPAPSSLLRHQRTSLVVGAGACVIMELLWAGSRHLQGRAPLH